MNRRSFLEKLGLGMFAAVIAPSLLEPALKRLFDTRPLRTLKATWTMEPAQDFQVYYGEEVYNELIEEMHRQIDNQIINDI